MVVESSCLAVHMHHHASCMHFRSRCPCTARDFKKTAAHTSHVAVSPLPQSLPSHPPSPMQLPLPYHSPTPPTISHVAVSPLPLSLPSQCLPMWLSLPSHSPSPPTISHVAVSPLPPTVPPILSTISHVATSPLTLPLPTSSHVAVASLPMSSHVAPSHHHCPPIMWTP